MSKPTAEIAPSAAPPHALLIWCDLNRIYIQMPSQNGPCVIDYPRDSHALSDILRLMKDRHAAEGAGDYILPTSPLTKRDERFTPKQRDTVAELLRRKGITGRSR